MREEDRELLRDEAGKRLETFLARAARFAEKGRLVPRMNPDTDMSEVRRMIGRLRRREVPPLFDWTHEETAEFFECALEQEEIIRESGRDGRGYRTLSEEVEERNAREQMQRDVDAFHVLKKEAATREGGERELLRELDRIRRAMGGRSRGRRR